MTAQRNHIKVFVASTVHDFQYELDKIYELLDDNYGYSVLNSHKGTFLTDSSESNLTNCTNGVDECDVFIGFIRPTYGSGVLEDGGKSITHIEFDTAIKRRIPRFIMADFRVVFSRSLIRKATIKLPDTEISINSTNINFNDRNLMDVRCIRIYEEMIKDKIPPIDRKGNWVQEYRNFDDIRLYLESQFQHPERIQALIDKTNNLL